jgi:hypothetical protein
MCAKGVRTLAAWCLGRGGDHFRVLEVNGYSDGVPVPSFGPRLHFDYGIILLTTRHRLNPSTRSQLTRDDQDPTRSFAMLSLTT